MKVILECSHQYINTIKRKLNAHLEQITYLDSFTGNDLSLFIKEVKNLDRKIRSFSAQYPIH